MPNLLYLLSILFSLLIFFPSKIVLSSTATIKADSDIQDFIETLSSSEFQGRLTGTPGEKKAKEFLVNALQDIKGIEPFYPMLDSFEHQFSFYNPKLNDNSSSLVINHANFILGEDFLPFVTSSAVQQFDGVGFTVFSCDPTDILPSHSSLDISGKIIIVLESDCNAQISVHKKSLLGILRHLSSLEPAMIIMVSKDQNIHKNETIWLNHINPTTKEDWQKRNRNLNMAVTQRRSMMFDDMKPLSIPALYVLESSLLKHLGPVLLKQGITFSGEVTLRLDISDQFLSGTNIVSHIKGRTDKNIVLSAHYDSQGLDEQGRYFPGADDNASGVAAAIELFREAAWNADYHKPEQGMILVLFSGEEWGLVGSRSFTRDLKAHQLSSSILANINLDSISRGDDKTFYLLGSLVNPDLATLIDGSSNQQQNPESFNISFFKNLEFSFREGSDHYAFHEIGVPSVDITTGRSPEMDTIQDVPDTIKIDKILNLIHYLKYPLQQLTYAERLSFETPKKNYAPYPDSPRAQSPLEHHLTIQILPNRSTNNLILTDTLGFNQKPESFRLASSAEHLQIFFNESPILFDVMPNVSQDYATIIPHYPAVSQDISGTVSFSYSFSVNNQNIEDPSDGSSRFETTNEHPITLTSEGLYLSPSGYWYPRKTSVSKTDLERFEIMVYIPSDWSSITNGHLTNLSGNSIGTCQSKQEQWIIDQPSEPIYLIAGPYVTTQKMYRGISLQTYFYQDLQKHSTSYISKLESYIDRYIKMFGSYPYTKFTAVSNFFSTGYGMPSFTLLDRNIISFPFIKDISLGHELLHNYWGNSVFVKPNTGNWSEGLTTFQADYLYEKEKGPDFAREYRANILRDYQNYVTRDTVFALRNFTERNSAASRLIGYGKGMMFWSMLEDNLGQERFLLGLQTIIHKKTFQFISYDDFRLIFETLSDRSLTTFFDQWINRTDVPSLSLDTRNGSSANENILSITQKTDTPYSLEVPVRINFNDGTSKDMLIFTDQLFVETVIHEISSIKSIVLDPDFRLMRTLLSSENPPTLSRYFGANSYSFYSSLPISEEVTSFFSSLPGAKTPVSISTIDFLRPEELPNIDEIEDETAKAILLKPSDLNNPWTQKLLGNLPLSIFEDTISIEGNPPLSLQDHFIVLTTSFNERPVLVVISSNKIENLNTISKKLVHYGKYSYLIMNRDGEKVSSGIWKSF